MLTKEKDRKRRVTFLYCNWTIRPSVHSQTLSSIFECRSSIMFTIVTERKFCNPHWTVPEWFPSSAQLLFMSWWHPLGSWCQHVASVDAKPKHWNHNHTSEHSCKPCMFPGIFCGPFHKSLNCLKNWSWQSNVPCLFFLPLDGRRGS